MLLLAGEDVIGHGVVVADFAGVQFALRSTAPAGESDLLTVAAKLVYPELTRRLTASLSAASFRTEFADLAVKHCTAPSSNHTRQHTSAGTIVTTLAADPTSCSVVTAGLLAEVKSTEWRRTLDPAHVTVSSASSVHSPSIRPPASPRNAAAPSGSRKRPMADPTHHLANGILPSTIAGDSAIILGGLVAQPRPRCAD